MYVTVIGTGRAGTSFAQALRTVGHQVTLVHHDDLVVPPNAELVVLCVPDDQIAAVAARLEKRAERVVAHVAGSRGLDELGDHPRVGYMHPLAVLPDEKRGAARLLGATYSVGGDALVAELVASLGGRVLTLVETQRALYHATATVAANHLVALMGHVEALATAAGLSLQDFLPLAHEALDDVEKLGVARALTGPASRGDVATIDAHLAAIPDEERSAYVALAHEAFQLAEHQRLAARV